MRAPSQMRSKSSQLIQSRISCLSVGHLILIFHLLNCHAGFLFCHIHSFFSSVNCVWLFLVTLYGVSVPEGKCCLRNRGMWWRSMTNLPKVLVYRCLQL